MATHGGHLALSAFCLLTDAQQDHRGSLNNRVLVVVLACALGAWGWWAAGATPIDAIPDLSDNQVIVFTEWPGHSAQEVEDQVSYPLTVNLQGLAGVRVVRSQSAFGFSMIYAVFEDDIDQYFARARVLERLSLVTTLLPEGTAPTLGPDATGVGHVFWYTVESDQHSLRDLRSIQDWFVRYQLNAVPGVAEVASIGGHVQQYQIDIDPNRLRAYNLSLGDVVEAVREEQPERRRQRARSQRHVVDRPRRRADRIGRGPEADRGGRIGRRAGLRAPGGRGARRRRLPRGVAGERAATRRSAASSSRARARTRSR